jgi:hypothetical protein
VWRDKKGVCGELAILLIVMLRHVGIKTNYVSVDIDSQGEKVSHACACAVIETKTVLPDPAYHTFDAKHKSFKILTDKEAIPHFKSMR